MSPVQEKTLRAAITAERKRAGLRQEDLAKKLKKDQTWVARLENGKRGLGVVEFFQLARVIGFDPIATLARLHQQR